MFRPLKLRHYLAFTRAIGLKDDEVLEGSEIEVDKLQDVNYLVDSLQSRVVVMNMMRLTENQYLGFEVGRQTELIDLGIVGHAMLSCANARASAGIWVRFSNELLGSLVKTVLIEQENGGCWSLIFTGDEPTKDPVFRFCVEELLMIAGKLGGQLANQQAVATRLQLSYGPSDPELYSRYIGCLPEFNAKCTKITFSAPSLDVPFRGTDEEFNAICVQHCSQIARQVAGTSPLIGRLRDYLLSQRGGYPGLDEAASSLDTSPRTLRRQLQKHEYTYKRLVNEVRLELAKEYLASGHITPKEVAYLVGFKTADAFRVAFKQWTGVTVGQFQADNSPNL